MLNQFFLINHPQTRRLVRRPIKVYRRLYVKPATTSKIHTIGDSHSCFGWKGIIQHHLGPTLCYSFGKEKLDRCDIRNFDIKDGDTIVFCLGEIDCRCHIHKHITDTITYQSIIDSIVDNYFEAIELNVTVSQLKLKNVCVYNVVPPNQTHDTISYYPLDEERKKYVLYFNEKLKEKCIEKNYIFFDVYNSYIDENGFLKKDLSDGDIHIGNDKGIYISKFIKENL